MNKLKLTKGSQTKFEDFLKDTPAMSVLNTRFVFYSNEQINLPFDFIGQLGSEGTTRAHLGQPSCSSRVPLEHIAQDCVLTASEHLQDSRLHNLSRQSVPGLSPPHIHNFWQTVKEQTSRLKCSISLSAINTDDNHYKAIRLSVS